MTDETFNIHINTDNIKSDLTNIDQSAKNVKSNVDRTVAQSRREIGRLINTAQQSWQLVTAILKASGLSINQVLDASVKGIFSVGESLSRLAAAQATAGTLNPFLLMQSILTATAAGFAIAAAVKAEQDRDMVDKSISRAFMSASSVAGAWYTI